MGKELKGLEGWLAIFIFFVTILSPLEELSGMLGYRHFDVNPTALFMGVAFIAVHLITGALLVLKRPSALSWVIALLVVRTIEVLVALHDGEPSSAFYQTAVVVFWLVYFMNSKRVRNTYGRNILSTTRFARDSGGSKGYALPQACPEAPEAKYCVECGKQILLKAEMCPNCGRKNPAPLNLALKSAAGEKQMR